MAVEVKSYQFKVQRCLYLHAITYKMPVVESCVYLHVTICMMSVATKNVYFVILNKRYSTSLSTLLQIKVVLDCSCHILEQAAPFVV